MFKDTFEIEKGDVVAITGGGGKTSLMFHLAGELSELGRVLVTTTTKIYTPSEEKYEKLVVGGEVSSGQGKNISVAGRKDVEGKLHGLTFEEVGKLLPEYDYVLIEADGAKMKQMKGWREDEPSIPPFATKVIGVANIKSLGKSATKENVHRLDTFLKMVETDKGGEISLEVFGRYLQRGDFFKGSQGKNILFLNGVEERKEEAEALELGNQVEGLYFGSVREKRIIKHKKINAVVMASGYSRRFGEEDKLLRRVEGVPVIEHLLKTLSGLPFKRIVLVGRSGELERLCGRYGYDYVENDRADLGQSESIKAGVRETSGGGLMFFTGDQPLLRGESILKLLQTFQEEDLITRPVSGGMPSSPVIFPERYREDLMKLMGDTGGREVVRNAGRIREVEFPERDEFMDIDTEEDIRRVEKVLEGRKNGVGIEIANTSL